MTDRAKALDGGAKPERVIPLTPIMRRYQRLRGAAQAERLAEARRILDHPEELAVEFATSVRRFATYRNADEPFYDSAAARRRARHRPGAALERTNDLVLRLEELAPGEGVHPIDARSRLTARDGDSVVDVPATSLAFEYADRELLVQRTMSPARWEDGRPNRGGVRLDALLANLADRTPIVAEVKVGRDMDAFFALVQALAGVAHLATPSQYERLRRHVARGDLRKPTDPPRLDVYVLFVDSVAHGAYLPRLTAAASEVARCLLGFGEVTRSVRRIAGLDIELGAAGLLAARVRWAWGPVP
jgi:hypothetical protein